MRGENMPRKKIDQKDAERIATQVVKGQDNPYRDERGGRKQVYRRFKEGVDFMPVEGGEMVAMLKMAQNSCKKLMGRPPTFQSVEELQEAIEAYWDYIVKANENGGTIFPDAEGLAMYLGVSRETVNEWERSNYKNFSATIKTTKNAIAACKKQLALANKIPQLVWVTDFNNNHGYVQKQEVTVAPVNPLGEQVDQKALESKLADIVVEAESTESL